VDLVVLAVLEVLAAQLNQLLPGHLVVLAVLEVLAAQLNQLLQLSLLDPMRLLLQQVLVVLEVLVVRLNL
jgi:hypothetical protein